MDCDLTRWLPDSPWSSPARRWLRGCWLHARRKRARRSLDDDGVRRVIGFLRAGGNARGPADPALADALALYGDSRPDRRWRLEAYLLTEEPVEVVAARCQVQPEVVRAYHDVFFEVRPHREAGDWVWLQAVRAGGWGGFGEEFPGSLWKGLAYAAGPLALELGVAVTTGTPLPDWARGEPGYGEARLRLLGKLVAAAVTAGSPAELAGAVEVREQLRGLDRRVLGADPEGGMVRAMEGFLKSASRSGPGRDRRPAEVPASEAPGVGQGRGEPVGWREAVDSLLTALG